MQKASARNGAIDVYKFIFCLIIAAKHFYGAIAFNSLGLFPAGRLGVEFFVLSSGIFFFSKWEREHEAADQAGGGGYLRKYYPQRYFRLFLYAFVAYIFGFLIVRIFLRIQNGTAITLGKLVSDFSKDIWEILLVNMWGIRNTDFINSPIWTVSSLLLSELIILLFLRVNKKVFFNLAAPISIILIYANWRHCEYNGKLEYRVFGLFGTLRVFAILCISYYCLQVVKLLQKRTFTKTGRIFLTVIEALSVVVTIYIAYKYDTRNFVWLGTLLIFIFVAISMSGQSYITEILHDSRKTQFLGQMSMGVYFMHFPLWRLLKWLLGSSTSFGAELICFPALLVVAFLYILLMKLVMKLSEKLGNKLKSILIASD